MNKILKIAVSILCLVALTLSLGGCKIVLAVRQVPVVKYVEKST